MYALNYAWKIKLQNATKNNNNNKKEIIDNDDSCDTCIYSSSK